MWLFLCAAFVIGNYPLLFTRMPYGHDILGSMSRIESMAVAIKNGQFPIVILPTQAGGFGCLGILYSHLFFYIPALAKCAGASTICAYQFGCFVIQLMAAFLMVCSVRMIQRTNDENDGDDRCAAFFAAALFLLMPYRIGDMFWREAFSESIAMSFLPLIIAAVYQMGKAKGTRAERAWIWLSLGMTGVFQSHMLTFIIAVVMTTVLCLMYIKKDIIIGAGKAAGLFILLNLWYIVPFLRFYFMDINTDYLKTDMSEKAGSFSEMLFAGDYQETPNVIGVISFLILILSAVALIRMSIRKKKGEGEGEGAGVLSLLWYLFASGVIGIFLASSYFPWKVVGARIDAVNMFQFPFRFLLVEAVCFPMLAGLLFGYDAGGNKKGDPVRLAAEDRRAGTVSALSLLIALLLAAAGVVSAANEYNGMNTESFDYTVNNADFDYRQEYLPEGVTSADFADNAPIIPPNFTTLRYEKDYGRIEWAFENADEQADSCIDVPLIYYPGYLARLLDEEGKKQGELETTMGNHHWVRVLIPKEIRGGTVLISYGGFWYFKLAGLISLISLVFLIGLAVYSKKRRI
ncbi:MAG: hypothetical protein K6G83_06905 [Lachnospiraceae bacterium]|nr:hypothetical protein [Lachnospiraceae bacterium]